MCGIAGIVRCDGHGSITPDSILSMIAAIGHRGPDEAGAYLDDDAALGHSRLSVIDLEGGHQPIHNEDESLWIVFNGEIFNYPELREGLLARGHRFYTASDTEVILHLFEESGPGCLDRLNGQFAFAIWDTRNKSLFLARDRVGIRPLYYTRHDGFLYFASEIKSLFANRQIPRKFAPESLDQVFTFWTTLPGKTVFEGIRELPPGHLIVSSRRRFSKKRYWDIPFLPPGDQPECSEEYLRESVYSLIGDAVKIRLRSDVEVGCYLSGGLDSTAITGLIKTISPGTRLRTFGIRFQEDAFDEGYFQKMASSFLGTDHAEVMASNEAIENAFSDVVWHCEMPLLRTSPGPMFLLSDSVRRGGLKVVLTGEGADEVFGGYNIFRETLVRKFWSRYPESTLRPILIGKLYPYIFRNARLKNTLQSFFRAGLDHPDAPFFSHMIRWANTSRLKTFFSKEMASEIGVSTAMANLERSLPPEFFQWDSLCRAQYLEMALFMSNYLLSSQGDRMALAHGVETRMPFLDYRVVEKMARVPSKWKIFGLQEKYLLKKVVGGLVPPEILARPKTPYRAPIHQSLLTGEKGMELLSGESLSRTGYFDAEKVSRLVRKVNGTGSASELDDMAIAGIYSVQILHDRFISHFEPCPVYGRPIKTFIDRRSAVTGT